MINIIFITNMKIPFLLLSLLFLFPRSLSSLSISDTHISTTRNTYRSTICSYSSYSYTSADIQSAQKYINQYNYLTSSQIESLIFDRQYTLDSNTLVLIMPHLLGFAVAIVLWIPLCLCCVWPQRHPACRRCRKPEKEYYNNCELKWTAYLTIVFYIVVAVGGIIAVMGGPNIVMYFNDVGCKMTSIGDDLVNGKISSTVANRFFTGLSPFSTDLTSFISSFNTIWTQSSNSLNLAGNIKTNQTTYQLQINSTYSTYTNPTYSTAFALNGTAYQDVVSAFKTLYYGPTTNSETILGKIYSTSNLIFTEINNVLDPMIYAWGNLSAVTQSGVTTQMTATVTSSNSLQVNLNDFMDKIGAFFNNGTMYKQLVLLLKAFYGCFFALALLGGLSAILLGCFSVVRIRLIMYFTCGFMYFLSIISFGILIFLSILGPNLSQVCSYMGNKFSTGTGTADFFSKMGWSKIGALTTHCMTDGTGWMMNDISPTFNTSFANLLTITQGTQLLNSLIPNYSTANLTAPITSGSSTVTKVQNAQLLDVTDSVATDFIQGVRLIAYPLVTCTNPANVNADAWVPSYSLYTCPSGKAQNGACGNLGNISTCPNGCYEIMNQLQSAAGDTNYATTLQTRYGATCNYYDFIKNLQLNWNIPRKNNMATVQTSLSSLLTSVTNYDNAFKAVQANITTFSTILQTNYDGLTNLITGTFNGMDCRVIGQSILDFQNSLCVGFLSSLYYNIIALILLSYGSLMVACCGTCAGVRHFKHLQKMKIVTGYKGVPVAISEQRIFDVDK